MVIWLIGISGSGKSTLGEKLKNHFDSRQIPAFRIDGDSVRKFFDNDLGYSREDRMENIKRILLSAHVLSQCGIRVIVCNIHPFEELRRFARNKIPGYNEIYLKKNIDRSMAEDVRNVYRSQKGKTPLVGIDLAFDEPGQSDLILETDRETPDASFKRIIAFLESKYPELKK